MKKLLAMLLCLVMAFSLLAACGGNGDEAGKKDDGKVTLTIGLPKSALVQDYEENYYTKWLEEKTGYNLEFQYFAASGNEAKAQLSTLVSDNLELPDILWSFDLGADLYERYGRDGVFIDLAPYFNDKEKSALWWERFGLLSEESQKNNWQRMQSGDGEGHIYAFPEFQESMIDIMDYQVWINQEWLDRLSLEMPTDPESLYNVLKAFKEQDANGNGDPNDEVPMVGTANSLSGETLHWLINMFVYEDDSTWFNVDESGKLYSPYTTDKYREALKYIRKLMQEGLLSPLVLTTKHNDMNQLVCPGEGQAQTAGVVCVHLNGGFTEEHEGILNYEAMPLWGNAVFRENMNFYSTFITKGCENVDAAWNLLMCMTSEESSIIQRYGKEGESWDWAPEGTTSVMGTPAKIRLYRDTWNDIGNDNWRNVDATILLNSEGEGNQAVPEEETEVRQHKYNLFNKALKNYYNQIENYNPPKEQVCPLLIWPDEYKEEVPYARGDCQNYIVQERTAFITGTKDIDSDEDWQKYLDKLNSLGLDKWLYYSQLVYDETVKAED